MKKSSGRRDEQFGMRGIMVWSAISYGSRPPLLLLEKNMKTQDYIHSFLELVDLSYDIKKHLLPDLSVTFKLLSFPSQVEFD